MPRRRTLVAFSVIVLLTVAGLFLVQPELLQQLTTTSGHRPQLRKSFEGGEDNPLPGCDSETAAAPATPAPTPPPTPAPSPAPTPAPFSFRYPLVVEKKAASSRMRVVFLVGLEGTGHHYLADVLDDVCKAPKVRCPKMCVMAKVLYPDLSLPKSRNAYWEARKRLREEMEKLAAFPEESLAEDESTVVSFGACRHQGTGMMSYPNFNGNEKAIQYVDFRLVAEEAERAGVDMRFVYLARSAEDILASDSEHNNYGGSYIRESRILLNNLAVVHSTFQEMDPAFTTCFRYGEMANPAQASRVAGFLAPNNHTAENLAGQILSHVKTKKKSGGKGGKRRRHLEYLEGMDRPKALVVTRLQQRLDMVEKDVCSAADR
ncbi:unnamed protein product [Ectocarpus fasciculatus]